MAITGSTRLAVVNRGLIPSESFALSGLNRRCKNTSSKSAVTPQSYCLDLVRKYDYENYLSSLLLSNENGLRSTAIAVRGFNVEVSKIQDKVSESKLAQMRLQFWLESLEHLFKDSVPEHPVAQELHRAIQRHKLKKHHLISLVTARTNQLSAAGFSNLEAMEKYAESTVSPVYYSLLQAAGVQNVHADHAASHLGKAQGVAGLVRGLPHHCTQRVVSLPADVLARHRVATETVLRGSRDQPLRDVVFEVATRAKQHLDKACSLRSQLPSAVLPLLLPAAATAAYLERLQKLDFDVFHPSLQRRNATLPWTLFVNKLFKRF